MESYIRPAGKEDLGAVNSLLRQVLAVHHGGRPDLFRGEGKKYTDSELLSIFADPLRPVFVYDRDGEVLGYVFCEIQELGSEVMNPLKSLYINDLCVDEGHRGEHVGRALFEYARRFAEDSGCHNITLHVWECNPSARAFYDAMGMSVQYTSMELLCK
jgi:ribosomal protein S18 acetylase RimI-like enzyme